MKLDELYDYKNQLLDDLLTNDEIIHLLTNDGEKIDDPSQMIFDRVFPFEYIPDTKEDAKTFICCDIDIQRSSGRNLYYAPYLYVWEFTHKSKLRLPEGGVRVDKLASEIVASINGSRNYGLGELNFYSSKRFSPISDYLGKVLVFHAKDIDRLHPTGMPIPSNRKTG